MLIKLEIIRTESEPVMGPQWDRGFTTASKARRLHLGRRPEDPVELECVLQYATKGKVRSLLVGHFYCN